MGNGFVTDPKAVSATNPQGLNLFGVTPPPLIGPGAAGLPPWLVGMPTQAIAAAMAAMARNGINPATAQLQQTASGGTWTQSRIVAGAPPAASSGFSFDGGGGGGGGTGKPGSLGPGGIASAATTDRAIAAVSRNFGGFLDVGSATDRHRIGIDGDGRAINSAHIWTGALYRMDDQRDGSLMFERQPYPNPPPLPGMAPVHLQWDGVQQQWRWWAESPVQFITTPPTRPCPTQVIYTQGSWAPEQGAQPYMGMTMALGAGELLARALPRQSGLPNYDHTVPTGPEFARLAETTPITGRLVAFGAQAGAGEFIYTARQNTARFPGGTASGGWLMLPPEADILDQTPAGTVSSTVLALGKGVRLGHGQVDLATGAMDTGWTQYRDPATDALVTQVVSGGTETPRTTIPAAGGFAFRGSGANADVTLDSAVTAARTATLPNLTGTVGVMATTPAAAGAIYFAGGTAAGELAHDLAKLNYAPTGGPAGKGKFTVSGVLDPNALELTSADTDDVYVDWDDGQTVAVSAAGHARMRYNDATKKLEASRDGGAYADISAGGVTDHGALTGLTDSDHPVGALAFTATDTLAGRSTAGAGAGEEIACTAFARSILDDADAATVRATIGAGTGSGTVTSVTGTSPVASSGGTTPAISLGVSAGSKFLASTALNTWAEKDITAAGLAILDDTTAGDQLTTLGLSPNAKSLVTAADYAAMRGLLDLEVGTDFLTPAAIAAAYQPLDTDLSAIAALVSAADKLPYATGAGTWTLADLTAAGRALLDDASAAAQRATLDVPSTSEAILDTLIDAKGDLIVGTAADTPARLAVGTNGHVLTADSGEASGVKWAAAAGGSLDITGLTAADPALGDELPIYDISAAANRKVTIEELGFLLTGMVGGRLTLTSGTSVTTSDVTAAGTLYYAIHTHDKIALYDGTRWKMYTFTERSLALTLTSGKNYDVFLYDNAGTLTLELSAAWTNDTTRADALTTQDGVLVKSGATTRRYLGTIRASAANVTEDSAAKRFVWNMYNRVSRPMRVADTAGSWTFSTASTYRQVRASSANQVEFVVGIAGDAVSLCANHICNHSSGGCSAQVGIGVDSTTVNSAKGGAIYPTSITIAAGSCRYDGVVGVGYHYAAWLEGVGSDVAATVTWYGSSGLPTGMSGVVRA